MSLQSRQLMMRPVSVSTCWCRACPGSTALCGLPRQSAARCPPGTQPATSIDIVDMVDIIDLPGT